MHFMADDALTSLSEDDSCSTMHKDVIALFLLFDDELDHFMPSTHWLQDAHLFRGSAAVF